MPTYVLYSVLIIQAVTFFIYRRGCWSHKLFFFFFFPFWLHESFWHKYAKSFWIAWFLLRAKCQLQAYVNSLPIEAVLVSPSVGIFHSKMTLRLPIWSETGLYSMADNCDKRRRGPETYHILLFCFLLFCPLRAFVPFLETLEVGHHILSIP